MTFQMMFALFMPAPIFGVFSERMKCSSMLFLMDVWLLIVYASVCHRGWGGGSLGQFAIHDFVVGNGVRLNAGIAGLVSASVVGNVSVIGARLRPVQLVVPIARGRQWLWAGWFGLMRVPNLLATAPKGWRWR